MTRDGRIAAVVDEIARATGTIVPSAYDVASHLLDHHDKRQTELLNANNKLVEERRSLGRQLAESMARHGRLVRRIAELDAVVVRHD